MQILLCTLATLLDPDGTYGILAYRLPYCCLRPKEKYRLPLYILKVEKYILKRSCLSNADFIEIQGIAGGDLGIPSAVVKLS